MAMKTDFSSKAGLRGCIIVLLAGLIIPAIFSWAQADDTVVLTVSPGDNLVTICEKRLEDPRKWDEVARLNHIRNPHRIYPRMTIRIPVRLLRGVPIAAKVTFVKGHVTVRPRGTEGWTSLALGDQVGQGGRVKTGSQSAAELTYEDGSSVLLRDNTEIEVLRARRKSDSYRVQDLFVHLGQAIAKVRKMISREPRFRMHTPTSVTGVRGTEFRTSVDTSDASRFEVLAGTVGVAAMRTEVTVAQGEGTLVNKGKAPLAPPDTVAPAGIYGAEAVIQKPVRRTEVRACGRGQFLPDHDCQRSGL